MAGPAALAAALLALAFAGCSKADDTAATTTTAAPAPPTTAPFTMGEFRTRDGDPATVPASGSLSCRTQGVGHVMVLTDAERRRILLTQDDAAVTSGRYSISAADGTPAGSGVVQLAFATLAPDQVGTMLSFSFTATPTDPAGSPAFVGAAMCRLDPDAPG